MKEIICKVRSKYQKRYENGYPLIHKDSFMNKINLKEEGNILKLVDDKNKFIAKGYLGLQNKGIGWILTRKDEKINEAFFRKTLLKAISIRQGFFKDDQTTAFRLFNGEGDGIGGLTIDYFDGFYLINWYSRGIYEFEENIISVLKQYTDAKGIYQKKRFAQDGKFIEEDGYVWGERGKFPIIVKENGIKFAIYLNEGAMVGVFLDQKDVRKRIKEHYAKGKTVLNTFSYTGAFSVAAALGAAKETTSVDLANRSLPRTKEHFFINHIEEENQRIIVRDVFDYFKVAKKKNIQFDMVVLDPPSFAQSKKRKFSAAKDYKELLKDAIDLTKDKGIILASTNCATFDMKKMKEFVQKGFYEKGISYKILEEYGLPKDFKTLKSFPQGNYLKVLFIQKYS